MRIGILGAGMSGLSAAFFLRDTFTDIQVHEASDAIGGLARSFRWHGFDCDLAPHRFFTEDEGLLERFLALVPLEKIKRRSRVYLRGRWLQDPINGAEVVLKFLPFRSVEILWTYLFRKRHPEDNFECMALSKFGTGLNKLFFRPYSEKLFGIPATEISSFWGRHKLRMTGLKNLTRRDPKLYFDCFYYPKQGGYGSICRRIYEDVQQFVRLRSRLVAVTPIPGGRGYRCEFVRGDAAVVEEFDVLVSSLPLPYFAGLLGLDLPMRFRSARLTYLLLDKGRATENHWIYFADDAFIINRVAEFKNFRDNGSPADKTVLCCEVTRVDDYSLEEIIRELEAARLIKRREILDTMTVDIEHAYPIWDLRYEDTAKRAEQFFAAHPNIYHLGRHAQFVQKDVDDIFSEAEQTARRIAVRREASLGREAAFQTPYCPGTKDCTHHAPRDAVSSRGA